LFDTLLPYLKHLTLRQVDWRSLSHRLKVQDTSATMSLYLFIACIMKALIAFLFVFVSNICSLYPMRVCNSFRNSDNLTNKISTALLNSNVEDFWCIILWISISPPDLIKPQE